MDIIGNSQRIPTFSPVISLVITDVGFPSVPVPAVVGMAINGNPF